MSQPANRCPGKLCGGEWSVHEWSFALRSRVPPSSAQACFDSPSALSVGQDQLSTWEQLAAEHGPRDAFLLLAFGDTTFSASQAALLALWRLLLTCRIALS